MSETSNDSDIELYQQILKNAADGIVTISEQGIIHSFNPAAEKMFACCAADVIGENVNCLMPDPDKSQHDHYLHQYLETEQGKIIGIGSREVIAKRRDGSCFDIDLAISELHRNDGQRLFIGSLRDITRRKQAEDNVLKLALFVKNNPGTVLKVSIDYKILFSNPASQLLLEKLHLQQGDSVPQRWQASIDAAFESRELQQLEETIDDKTHLLTITRVEETSVNMYGVDISKRKQAEAELHASEERFSLITRGTKDGIWDWDLIADKIYFSPRWKAMLFYGEDDIKANFRALQTLIHPHDLGLALDIWTDCMGGVTDSFTVEYRLLNKRGSYTWVRCRGMTLHNDEGNPVRMAGSHTDISQQKQTSAMMEHMHRETLAKAEELEAAHRELQASHEQLLQSEKLASIGQLAAGVAHEINNPVGYVYSNLGSLQKYIDNLFQMIEGYEQLEQLTSPDEVVMKSLQKLKQELDLEYLKEDVRDLVSESREGISRVKGIVQDLKDFSHVDEAEWQWADLHRGLDSTLNIVNNEIKYKAEVVKEYGELPEVECLASQLNQVFMNLLVNAAHAIEDRGMITLRTGHENDKVWVAVSDTGSGITAENLKNIFDPFFTTKDVGTGTGLGLSLSYGIVQKHGGHIEVDSEVGKGTTFTVHLPVKQPQTQADKSDEATV